MPMVAQVKGFTDSSKSVAQVSFLIGSKAQRERAWLAGATPWAHLQPLSQVWTWHLQNSQPTVISWEVRPRNYECSPCVTAQSRPIVGHFLGEQMHALRPKYWESLEVKGAFTRQQKHSQRNSDCRKNLTDQLRKSQLDYSFQTPLFSFWMF